VNQLGKFEKRSGGKEGRGPAPPEPSLGREDRSKGEIDKFERVVRWLTVERRSKEEARKKENSSNIGLRRKTISKPGCHL